MKLSDSIRNYLELGKSFAQLGRLQIGLGHLEDAESSINTAIRLAQQTGDNYAYHMRLATLGRIRSEQGRHEEALQYYDQALAAMSKLGKPFDEATLLVQIGKLYSDVGNNPQALIPFEKAHEIVSSLRLDDYIEMLDENIQIIRDRINSQED